MGLLKRLVNKARISSPYIFHFNSGGCNGCDIEILASLTPRIDLERFGIKLGRADVLLPLLLEIARFLPLLEDRAVLHRAAAAPEAEPVIKGRAPACP